MDIETIKNEIKEHILDSVQEDVKNATISWRIRRCFRQPRK